MNRKHFFKIVLALWVLALSLACAETADTLTQNDLAALLRAEDNVIGLRVKIEAAFAGRQVNQDGDTYALFIARNADTTFLFLLPHTEDIETVEMLEGTIFKVDLQEQNIRDQRIYAVWLEGGAQ